MVIMWICRQPKVGSDGTKTHIRHVKWFKQDWPLSGKLANSIPTLRADIRLVHDVLCLSAVLINGWVGACMSALALQAEFRVHM